MTEPNERELAELAELESEMTALRAKVDAAYGPHRRIDPGLRAMVISVGVLLLAIAALLPWVDGAAGWQVLVDQAGGSQGKVDFIPRLFAIGVFVFGFLGSAASLGVRRWSVAWVTTLGCGLFTVLGIVSIWSQQTTTSHQAGPGPGSGLILSALVMFVLAVAWARVVWSRPGGVFNHRTD